MLGGHIDFFLQHGVSLAHVHQRYTRDFKIFLDFHFVAGDDVGEYETADLAAREESLDFLGVKEVFNLIKNIRIHGGRCCGVHGLARVGTLAGV